MHLRRYCAAALVLVAAALGGACGRSSAAGGGTSCSRFRDLGRSDQERVVQRMGRERHDDSPVALVRFSVRAYCLMNPENKINGIYGG